MDRAIYIDLMVGAVLVVLGKLGIRSPLIDRLNHIEQRLDQQDDRLNDLSEQVGGVGETVEHVATVVEEGHNGI